MPRHGGWESTGFGFRLKEVRESKGMTQKQLADGAGVHPNTLAKIERGEQEPAWPMVLALCATLGVPCTEFTGLKPEADSPLPSPGRPKKPAPLVDEEKPAKAGRKRKPRSPG